MHQNSDSVADAFFLFIRFTYKSTFRKKDFYASSLGTNSAFAGGGGIDFSHWNFRWISSGGPGYFTGSPGWQFGPQQCETDARLLQQCGAVLYLWDTGQNVLLPFFGLGIMDHPYFIRNIGWCKSSRESDGASIDISRNKIIRTSGAGTGHEDHGKCLRLGDIVSCIDPFFEKMDFMVISRNFSKCYHWRIGADEWMLCAVRH